VKPAEEFGPLKQEPRIGIANKWGVIVSPVGGTRHAPKVGNRDQLSGVASPEFALKKKEDL
jgi:hypothetical protein